MRHTISKRFLPIMLGFILLFSKAIGGTTDKIYISEFGASNKNTLLDEDGESSDWIEIFNSTKENVSLYNWFLTDNLLNLNKWTFPDIEIKAGEFLVIFASGKDRRDPGSNLHTNFKINKDGEYLALVNRSGTAVSEFAPRFARQFADISYGINQKKDTLALISNKHSGKLLLPSASSWEQIRMNWTGNISQEPFDDSEWKAVSTAIGFDTRTSGENDVNLAQGKPASQSSEYGGYPSKLGNDGNTGNFTHTANGDLDPWWAIDLEDIFFIDRIIIHNRDDCCQDRLYNITIEIFDHEGNLVFQSPVLNPVPDGEVPLSPGERLEYRFENVPENGVKGQKLKIKKSSVPGSREYLSLGEVEIFGVNSYSEAIDSEIYEMEGRNSAVFMRFPFHIGSISAIDHLQLEMRYDDGFIAFLNGRKVAGVNEPPDQTDLHSTATRIHYANAWETFQVSTENLREGENILAIMGLNVSAGDHSFFIHPRLFAFNIEASGTVYFKNPTPGNVNNTGFKGFVADTEFDVGHGFYENPFSVQIHSKTPGTTIIYTTDGSEPSLENGVKVSSLDEQAPPVAKVSISSTTIVRAAAFKEGLYPSDTNTHTYIFLNDVIDSEVMNKTITEDPRYEPKMHQSLTDLPTVSLVITPGTLTKEEDRMASLEWILPENDDEGFQENCGVKYFGGEWAGPFEKQNFRIYFRSIFGASRLDYPLFKGFDHGIPPVSTFDQLELRAGSHDMVQRGFYISNRFTDDSMLDMGNLNPHGRFVHLYLNGVYWGMYHLRERWNADMVAQYKGGEKEDYEAINGNKNIGGWALHDHPYDGDGTFWEEAQTLRDDYEAISRYIDLESYIDYMLLYMFGNCENEYRCVGSQTMGVGFQFQLNDADGFLRDSGNRTNMGQPGQQHADGPGSIFSMLFKEGHPAYKMLLADRIHKHFFNNGALTPEKIAGRLDQRCDEVKIPFYGEAARWGYRTPASWETAKNQYLSEVAPYRTTTVIQQFIDAGFYPDLNAPLFFLNNEEKYGGNFVPGDQLTFAETEGEIFFTLNGKDPYIPPEQTYDPVRLIETDAFKKVLIPQSAITEDWKKAGFDDSGWIEGTGGVGYEKRTGYEADIGIDVREMYTNYTSCLIRIPFEMDRETMDAFGKLFLKIKFNDGFIAYLNGTEIKRVHFNGDPGWNAHSTGKNEAIGIRVFDVTPFLKNLKSGENILAIHGLNASSESTDFLISASLEGESSVHFDDQLTESAIPYEHIPITLETSVVVKARAYKDGIWSALSEAPFTNEFDPGGHDEKDIFDVVQYPNPFDDYTTLSFQSAREMEIELTVFSLLGEKVWQDKTAMGKDETGTFHITTVNWINGMYVFQLRTSEGERITGKMICDPK